MSNYYGLEEDTIVVAINDGDEISEEIAVSDIGWRDDLRRTIKAYLGMRRPGDVVRVQRSGYGVTTISNAREADAYTRQIPRSRTED